MRHRENVWQNDQGFVIRRKGIHECLHAICICCRSHLDVDVCCGPGFIDCLHIQLSEWANLRIVKHTHAFHAWTYLPYDVEPLSTHAEFVIAESGDVAAGLG